jgi:hypothetical protein
MAFMDLIFFVKSESFVAIIRFFAFVESQFHLLILLKANLCSNDVRSWGRLYIW